MTVENLVVESVASSTVTAEQFRETLDEGDEMFEVFSDVANMNEDFIGKDIIDF